MCVCQTTSALLDLALTRMIPDTDQELLDAVDHTTFHWRDTVDSTSVDSAGLMHKCMCTYKLESSVHSLMYQLSLHC